MKINYKFRLSLVVFLAFSSFAIAQTSLGSSKTFMNKLKSELVTSTTSKGTEKTILLQVENSKNFKGKINYKESSESSEFLIGEIKDVPESSFFVKVLDKKLEGHIIFTGFIADEELAAHYAVADVYIMPSQKEGFGIVFIEALYYGKPVIAGNKDGSVDALKNGDLGLLINPDSREEITSALLKVLSNTNQYVPDHQHVMSNFGYDVYKQNWGKVLQKLKTT